MAAALRSDRPPILTLLDAMDEHLGAFEYDWRERFNRPLSEVFSGAMSWREAWNLTHELLLDSSSRIGAAFAGLAYPMSREAFILVDLYDLQHASKAKRKIKPYPRPNDSKPDVKRVGKTSLPPERVRALLQLNAPTRAGRKRGPNGRFVKQ